VQEVLSDAEVLFDWKFMQGEFSLVGPRPLLGQMHGDDAGRKEGGMKFGLFYEIPCAPNQSPTQRYEETLAQIELADELGFNTAWLNCTSTGRCPLCQRPCSWRRRWRGARSVSAWESR
jgi:hypothetical protein